MLGKAEITQLDHLFPVLRQLTSSERQIIHEYGQMIDLPAGQMLMQQGQQCQHIPFVMTGSLRVYKLSPNGREMTLYRIGPGDTCLQSIACRMLGEDFPALAQVEVKSRLFMLPAVNYHDILGIQPFWKDFLILTLYRHLTETMETLEAVAFSRTDRRLASWLLAHRQAPGAFVSSTHEAIAVELGTAREVVSRLLGDLQNKGAVQLGRGKIKILQPQLLEDLSEGDT